MLCEESLKDMDARALEARRGEASPIRIATLGEDILSLVAEVRRLRFDRSVHAKKVRAVAATLHELGIDLYVTDGGFHEPTA